MSMKIIKDGNGKEWEDKESAFKHLVERNLMDYAPFETPKGWILKLTTEIAKKTLEVIKAPKKRKYRKVIFQPRTDLSDPEQVVVSVNSESLVFTRGVETMIPVPHLEVLKNAQHMTHMFDGQDVLKNGVIHRYAYSDLGDVSESDYLAFLKKGTAEAVKDFK